MPRRGRLKSGLSKQCVAGTVLLSPQAAFTFQIPRFDVLWFFLGLGLFSAIAHILTILAFRRSDALTLAPLVYLELVGSVAIGFLVFHEVPTVMTLVGAGLIVFAGLLLAVRSNGSASPQVEPSEREACSDVGNHEEVAQDSMS